MKTLLVTLLTVSGCSESPTKNFNGSWRIVGDGATDFFSTWCSSSEPSPTSTVLGAGEATLTISEAPDMNSVHYMRVELRVPAKGFDCTVSATLEEADFAGMSGTVTGQCGTATGGGGTLTSDGTKLNAGFAGVNGVDCSTDLQGDFIR